MDYLEVCSIQCPYCWEYFETTIDRSNQNQNYTEDCQVCCNPIIIHVQIDANGDLQVETSGENLE